MSLAHVFLNEIQQVHVTQLQVFLGDANGGTLQIGQVDRDTLKVHFLPVDVSVHIAVFRDNHGSATNVSRVALALRQQITNIFTRSDVGDEILGVEAGDSGLHVLDGKVITRGKVIANAIESHCSFLLIRSCSKWS